MQNRRNSEGTYLVVDLFSAGKSRKEEVSQGVCPQVKSARMEWEVSVSTNRQQTSVKRWRCGSEAES